MIKGLTKGENRYLSRHECWLCAQRLDRDGCHGLVGGDACSPERMAERRKDCLKNYKPRKRKVKA